jgi:nicotinamidase-related amidase
MSLPTPPFFDPGSATRVFRVPYEGRAREAREWAVAHGIRPAAEDRARTALLLVDVQNTFCLPEHELFVAGPSGRGAIDDSARLASLLYRSLPRVTQVVVTLDSHTAVQIFHPVFWVDEAGEHPPPHTILSFEDIDARRWRVNPALVAAVAPRPGFDVEGWARHYARRLHEGGKYPLVVWPYHSMVGGIGHALVSVVEEAVFFHSIARQSPTRVEVKGQNPLTEHYSVLRPEVLEDPAGERVGVLNAALVDHLLSFDAVVVAGQAKSHCVAWTVEDLLSEIQVRDPRRAERVYLLEDCTSPVVVPGVADFSAPAEAAYSRFAEAGMHRVLSTTPMKDWPGVLGSK